MACVLKGASQGHPAQGKKKDYEMHDSRIRFALGLVACGALTACVGGPVPQTQLTEAKVSTSEAAAIGARDEPQAALHLKMAEDAIVKAEQCIAAGDNDPAVPLLERARADAELAKALTHLANREDAAKAALSRVDALERDLAPKGGQS
jgi:hypothetical protein